MTSRYLSITVTGLLAGLVLGSIATLSYAQTGFSSSFSDGTPQAQEFDGIHHVLDVLGNTNVYRLDRQTSETFLNTMETKSTVNAEPYHQASNTAPRVTPKTLSAPRKLDTRAF